MAKSCFFCGLVAFLPAKTSRLLTRDVLISTPAADKSFCRSLLVFLGSSLLFLKWCASSFAVVFCFHPQFAFCFGVNNPVFLNCLIIHATVNSPYYITWQYPSLMPDNVYEVSKY